MADTKSTSKQNIVDLRQDQLFELQCLIKADNIYQTAKHELQHTLFIAFVSGFSDLGLYYLKDSSSLPIIKRVPWFQNSRKRIACLCFDPLGSWLLIAGIDGSLYIVPAKTLVDEFYPVDQKWTTKDVTSFLSLNAQNSYSRPSALAWWQGVSFAAHTGIVGTEQGEVIFVNLETGQQVGSTKIVGRVISFHICQDSELDTVRLLITNHCKEQWHLVLEKPGTNQSCILNNGGPQQSLLHSEETDNEDSRNFPTARSRLRGLKQLSLEKLIILKQKLAETRNRNFESSESHTDQSSYESSGESESNYNENSNEKGFFSNEKGSTKCSTIPTALSNDMYIVPQCMKNGQTIYTRYAPSVNHVLVHKRSTDLSPHVYRVPENCQSILLTSRFFYISDAKHRFIYVVSRPLSEIKKKESTDLNRDSVVAQFKFDKNDEVVRNIYTLSSKRNDSDTNLGCNENKTYNMAKDITDLNVHIPSVDGCIVITSLGVYKIILRKHILSIFMDLIFKTQTVYDTTKLVMMFGLNMQQLMEWAGDIVLHKRQFSRAMKLYLLAGCRMPRSILKFAVAGHTAQLLGCLLSYSSTPVISELPEQDKINFSNLSVLAFTEIILKAVQSKVMHKDFLNFLSTNPFYDELFAINILVQTNMWNILHHLVLRRGLGPQVLDIIIKSLPTFILKNSNLSLHQSTHGLLMCLSDSSLIQGMLNNPGTARNHISFILTNLTSFQIFILQRLITFYDPTNAAVRPLLLRFKARRRAASRSSFSSQCDSLDLSEDLDEIGILMEEIIEVFLQTLLTILYKKQPCVKFISKYVPFTQLFDIEGKKEKNLSVDFRRRLLSTGYAHTALIRNGNIYTWGNCLEGCLGAGPTTSRYSTPQCISIFRRLGIEVLSISCGRCHTLAVTNNGVYAWGGNTYGQLGLGEVRQCPNPDLITSLAQEIIVEAVAGQYHSAALTTDGRLFTWGWGVHGQLGHSNTEIKRQPALVTSLLGIVIRHVSCGYAHTLGLSAEGYVYAFGCNLFGQLGIGNNSKCTSPVRISLLPERITLISTKYFHNLAISCTNKLYIWGSNPQILRLQWKERKVKLQKAKLALNEVLKRENAAQNAESLEGAKRSNGGDMSKVSINNNIKMIEEMNTVEESQAHLVPELVNTKLVHEKIVQISTGCYHSSLLTKDGIIYIWGRNLYGQLGTGYSHDIYIPTPLPNQPIDLFKDELGGVCTNQVNNDKNNANGEVNPDSNGYHDVTQKDNYYLKAVKICCGSNFTVAIQPGGNVLAWGNNDLAQLGFTPTYIKELDEKAICKLKYAKHIIRLMNLSDRPLIGLTPTQVSNIPLPTISYQSYDVTPLAGSVRPLSYVEHSLTDLTLHYALEQFHGLFGNFKILNKCIELKNYQACAKLELLEHNFVEALTYQFKALKECDPLSLESFSNGLSVGNISEDTTEDDNLQDNNELFEKHVEQNLVDILIENVKKQQMKMPVSKSLDSFKVIEQDLHTFDCQGGSEDLFENSKCDGLSEEIALEESSEVYNKINRDSPLSSTENSFSQDEIDNENILCSNYNQVNSNKFNVKKKLGTENILSQQDFTVMQHAINIVDFYLYEMEEDAYVPTCEMVATAVSFWVENKFPIKHLENVFNKYMKKIYYSLGLFIFRQYSSQNSTSSDKTNKSICFKNATKVLSTGFCIKVCYLILEHIEEGKQAVEYIEMLSVSAAKNYGPPLTGYPGTSENKTPEQMIDGIISTLSAKYYDPRPFIHIKDPDKVSELLTAEEDSMIFTCGHQFLMSAYKSEAIPRMETELLTLQSPLPSTAQVLASALYQSYKPETVCPICLSQAFKDVVKDVANR